MPCMARKEGVYNALNESASIRKTRGLSNEIMEENFYDLPQIGSGHKKPKPLKKKREHEAILKFHVQINNHTSKPYSDILQGVKFPKGKVVIGYDVWRLVEGDVSNDDHKKWFDSIDKLPEDYEIIKSKNNYYRQF